MGLKAVFFDLDDTLYGSFGECDAYACERIAAYAEEHWQIDKKAFCETFSWYRKKLARQQPSMPPIHDRVLMAQGTLERFGLNAIRHARTLHQIYWQSLYEKMQIRQGVNELLADLKARGIKTAVCTDMMADVQMEKLERLGLADSIDFLVSSEEAGIDKPASPIFWLALEKCRCLANEAIMLGDNFRHDVQGAMDCGIHGIWLNWNEQPCPEDSRAYVVAKTFEEAADYIRKRW